MKNGDSRAEIQNLREVDFPDPFVLRVDGAYYAYATNAGGINVQVLRSSDLRSWQRCADALPHLPDWAATGESLTWAPSILQRGARFVLYYTARFRTAGLQCIGCAVSDTPWGPFRDTSGAPFLCQQDLGGSIDPSPFVDDDGQPYLLWKNDGNSCGLSTALWIQPLCDHGEGLEEHPVELLRQDRAWEHPLIEAPALVKRSGRYYLFYSANRWESADYAIGYAVSDHVAGPYVRPRSGPWLGQDDGALGPGGQEFFTDTGGQLWIAYHAWQAPHVGYPDGVRGLHLAPLHFEQGFPIAAPASPHANLVGIHSRFDLTHLTEKDF